MTRHANCCGPSVCRSARRNKATYGSRSKKRQISPPAGQAGCQQEDAGQGQNAAAREDPHSTALQVVWPAAGRVPQVWHLPDLFPEHGQQRPDSRCPKSELVRTATMMTDPIADLLTRIRN